VPWVPEAHERADAEGPPPGRPWPAQLKRAAKALGIIARVQDDYDDLEAAEHVWTAAAAPFRPGAHAILSPYATHCREWPSPETWRMVAELGRRFEVIKRGADPP
jgi:hypothetical protein